MADNRKGARTAGSPGPRAKQKSVSRSGSESSESAMPLFALDSRQDQAEFAQENARQRGGGSGTRKKRKDEQRGGAVSFKDKPEAASTEDERTLWSVMGDIFCGAMENYGIVLLSFYGFIVNYSFS